MKKKLIKRAIFFMISCNMVVFTPTWASQETKNTIISSSIEVSDGSIKNIVNDDINIIDTNVRDEYGIFSNNGGKLNIDVDSLTIEHNIDRSNMFTSILSQGNTSQGSRSLIDIKTINDINIDNTAQELEQINAINAKDNANLNLLSKNGDININSNLNINRRLYDVNNSIINVENNSALKLDDKNMNINSTITDSYGQRLFNNYGINVKNSQLNINNQENMQINSTISGRGFDNYGVYVYDNLNQGSKVDIVNNGDLIINTNDNNSRNHSYGIFVINENNTDDETSVKINSKNNVVNTKSTGIEVSGELSNVNITASAGSNVIKALGDVDSTGIEVNDNGTLYLNAKDYNIVTSDYTGIHVSYADDKQSNITLNANNNIVNAVGTGILSFSNGNIKLNALNGNNAFTSNYIGISLMDNSQVNLKADKGENYFKIDEGIAILSSQSNVLAQANKNILEGIEGISSIDKSEVKLQAIDSNVINAKEFGIYTKEQGVVNLNATNANNTVYVENGYGISGNNSAININSQSGNNSIEVAQGIAIEANNGSNISLNANKGQNNIKSSDIAISVNKNNIDKDIATTSTNTVIKVTGKDNIINATTAIDNIDGGNVEIIASENNSIDGLVHAENKANTKIQGKVNYLKNNKDNAIESNNANVLVQGSENIIEATKGISSIDKSEVKLQATDSNVINAKNFGIYTKEDGVVNLNATNADNTVYVDNRYGISGNDSTININSQLGNNSIEVAQGIAIEANNGSNISVNANKGQNNIKASENVIEATKGISSIDKSEVKLQATDSNVINAKEFGIYTKEEGVVNLNATNANNTVYVENGYGISGNDSAININSQSGNNSIEVAQGITIEANNGSNISLNANNGKNNIKASDTAISVNKNNIDKDIATTSTNTVIKIAGKDNIINATTAIDNINGGNVKIIASENNSINGLVHAENKANTKIQGKINYLKNDKDNAIESNNANVLVQGNENIIEATKGISSVNNGVINFQSTNSNIIKAKEFGVYTKENSQVNLNATNANNIVYVETGYGISSNNSSINIDSQSGNNSIEVAQGIAVEVNNGSNISLNADKGQNNIKASDIAISVNKNNIDKDIATTSTNTVIKVTGKDNIINATTAIDNIDGGNVEIIASENNSIDGLIHAKNKANTKIQGKVNYLKNDNGQSVIWADAGTIDITGTSIIQANSQQVALLANNDMNNLNQGIITASFGQNSVIKGDIIAKDNGLIKLNVSNSNDDVSGLIIDGNILAENQGNISLDIGNNSLITGNINDYSYLADLNNQNLKQENLAGNISIDFNNKSRWNVVGQSFISKINTKENNIIDMVGYNTENKPHSLMVKEFNGDSNFVMNLNGNRQNTDMVYLNSGTGNYNVILANAVTKNDIGQNGLRFATVGDKNKQVFKNAVAYNDGFFNIKYQIASEDYDVNNEENTLYNNGDNSDLLTENRPGNDIINNIFGNNEDAVNYKLVNIEEKTLSNAGKTILNMTKANYDVAVFMGRLDKRMGDVHYLNKNDDGIWFRLRHDRIEKDLGYTVDGNMYELGYDKLFLRDNGQERLGLAFDYMKGSTSYDDIAGKGNNSRKGIWLYDTWIGDDGHYSDYILKWGHLENDFEIAGTKKLNLIKGNYDNDVFSASAEYGYMKNLKNDWYITPQVQLQLAKVTGADYITNQNTNVHVDGIDSIIGRAGFKLGKNFGDNKKNTFYLKADVLREFLGEQFVSVKDVTSDNEYVGFKYDHSGYWYDVGFGFNIETKKDSYAFLDVERRFGNGNKNSYQINGGFYWAL